MFQPPRPHEEKIFLPVLKSFYSASKRISIGFPPDSDFVKICFVSKDVFFLLLLFLSILLFYYVTDFWHHLQRTGKLQKKAICQVLPYFRVCLNVRKTCGAASLYNAVLQNNKKINKKKKSRLQQVCLQKPVHNTCNAEE